MRVRLGIGFESGRIKLSPKLGVFAYPIRTTVRPPELHVDYLILFMPKSAELDKSILSVSLGIYLDSCMYTYVVFF